ncbi:putative membrane protein [Sphingopyxis panaciterrae]|uniref:EamA family transporter n=1 Tax=Sphingopyxis panaciterrae TaxID=363841 RepID=UPI0031331730|nr:putative membrane protein [Sphingopyxis panaciterrae]
MIAIFIAALLLITGGFQSPATLLRRAWLFLILSDLAAGASWLCYFRAMSLGQAAEVAPVERISVVLVALFGVWFLGENLSVRA